MPHIHELIDFTVAAFIVHDSKVLLVHHKKIGEWLPVGGHIELNEDTDQALLREIMEETGLHQHELEFIENRPKSDIKHNFLLTPQYMDIHDISGNHRHIGLIYFVRSKSERIIHNVIEHNDIKWFSSQEIESTKMPANVKLIAKEAIKTLGTM
jgi:8-oxo-dGTP pyrophosphatase MutT (NUDIX family)